MIRGCLETVKWCDEVLVIDTGSTDKTIELAEQAGARVISFQHHSFARIRQEGLKHAKHDWIFYLDADERVTPTLAKEIMVHAETGDAQVLRLQRTNYFFGSELKHGGWGHDFVERVFARDHLQGWKGEIHESPDYTGTLLTLNTPLVHFSHRDTISGLAKTIRWTPLEAHALYQAQIPPVGLRTILRKGSMEFVRRAILKKGYRDGSVGLVEAVIQAINRMLVYIQVWELQQSPPITQRYQELEAMVQNQWKQES